MDRCCVSTRLAFLQVHGGGRDGGEWHPSRPQRSVRQRLRSPSDAHQFEQPTGHEQQPPRPHQPHVEEDARDAEVLGCFQQPGLDDDTAQQALSPLFPGLMLSAAGIITPASGGALGALDPAMQRARSLPGGSPRRLGDCFRPGRLMHVDSVGLVRLQIRCEAAVGPGVACLLMARTSAGPMNGRDGLCFPKDSCASEHACEAVKLPLSFFSVGDTWRHNAPAGGPGLDCGAAG